MNGTDVIQDETVTQEDPSNNADTSRSLDQEAAAELEGVPDSLKEQGDDHAALEERIAALEAQLAEARQDVLYARADTQNVRRRLEKDAQDARAYAATGFARDILSVSDNLARALQLIPEDLREDEKWKGLVVGLEATGRELDNVFSKHSISRIAAIGLPLDPNQHQAMIEIPNADAEPGTVVQELQAGYMIKDRLLRPALVAVAKKPD
ncbi:MAG: nucleotide exchange factor GrpE [Blastomonas fulva]|jgi:molecular chaperone GrpE|uniref:Protein GrpE n=1 Tax=Blastomonas fulva TaxID=1550728 RepID=A0ABN5B9Q4_9SPHN|nr:MULTISPECIES: nucleotide exchange factor GrpE [Blastomonas]AOF99066.1 grpE family protein [Blastomonas sp. RAC04]ASR52369.1 nucleotide exchange factor GrpE [Blastomonas fulva]MDK2755151.1 nucleotide exchange factor GrpE [Blastomonas fulva]MDM7929486.1 nucleotide exchange factor GrpE [Blastomonas fulva]MDM7965448.1 nucleotide exchange factor GrpE [Blastomonas fulva]